MLRPRVIPVLLIKDRTLVKSIRFKEHRYIGDPINAVRIFNELKADELILLDIGASKAGRSIPLELVRDIGEEARMPLAVGGGIATIDEIRAILRAGAEKVVIGTGAGRDPDFIRAASDAFGSTTIVVCIDVRKKFFEGEKVHVLNGTRPTPYSPTDFAILMAENGAGEIVVQSFDRDGKMDGYDIELIKAVSSSVSIPVIALGGAGSNADLMAARRDGKADAVAAGSLFVYQDTKRGVLINYPGKGELAFDQIEPFPDPYES